MKAAPVLVANNHLVSILGIFQKLNASRVTEGSAFDLLSSLTQYVPRESMAPYMNTIYQLIMTRLQSTKSNLYPIRFTQFLAQFSGLYGGQALVDGLDAIQPNVTMLLLIQVWLPKVKGCASNKVLAKSQIVGLTKVLGDLSTKLLGTAEGKQVFAQIILAVVSVLASPTFSKEEKDLPEETPMVYDATFSRLKYAQQLPNDPFMTVTDPLDFFLAALTNLSASHPGVLAPLIQQGLGNEPKLSEYFQSKCQSKCVNIV